MYASWDQRISSLWARLSSLSKDRVCSNIAFTHYIARGDGGSIRAVGTQAHLLPCYCIIEMVGQHDVEAKNPQHPMRHPGAGHGTYILIYRVMSTRLLVHARASY